MKTSIYRRKDRNRKQLSSHDGRSQNPPFLSPRSQRTVALQNGRLIIIPCDSFYNLIALIPRKESTGIATNAETIIRTNQSSYYGQSLSGLYELLDNDSPRHLKYCARARVNERPLNFPSRPVALCPFPPTLFSTGYGRDEKLKSNTDAGTLSNLYSFTRHYVN